jgi:hypothetical protein
MAEYSVMVHHEKLNVDFSIKTSAEIFRNCKDKDVIECFEDNGNCRKFLRSYLALKDDGQLAEQPRKTRKKKKPIEEDKELIPEVEALDEIRKEIDPALLPEKDGEL